MAYNAGNLKNMYSFTKEQITDFKQQFDQYDEDKSGTVEAGELKSVMEKCGVPMTAEAVAEMITEFDTDKDGSLNFQEFIAMMHKMTSGASEKDIRKSMFEVFDGNMDGYITVAELVAAWKKAAAESGGSLDVPSEAVLANLISEADQDGDGQLSEDEFMQLVEQCS